MGIDTSVFQCGSTWCCCGECILGGDGFYQKPVYPDPLAAGRWWAAFDDAAN